MDLQCRGAECWQGCAQADSTPRGGLEGPQATAARDMRNDTGGVKKTLSPSSQPQKGTRLCDHTPISRSLLRCRSIIGWWFCPILLKHLFVITPFFLAPTGLPLTGFYLQAFYLLRSQGFPGPDREPALCMVSRSLVLKQTRV